LNSQVFLEWLGQEDKTSICRSSEEVAVRVGHEVLIDVDDKSGLIVGDPRGILGQQLNLHPIYILHIIIILNTCEII
jgi:hypothetical protein